MKALVYTAPARGHLYPTVPLLLELQQRGHDVVIYTLGAEVDGLRRLGMDARPADPALDGLPFRDYTGRNALDSLKLGTRTMVERGRLDGPQLRAAIEQERPDVIVVDVLSWGAWAVAETSGLPWATIQHTLTPLPSPEVPPFGPGLKPRRGPLGRLRNRILAPLTLGAIERSVLGPGNELRASFGAPPFGSAEAMFTAPPLTLYLTSKSFEYPRTDWPASYCFTGPLNWDPPSAAPAWIDQLNRPVALVTASSLFQDDGRLIATALAALADEDLDVVATMPAGLEAQDIPANAHLEEFVPHSLLLPRSVVAITHGGLGATQKAMTHGVPVVVVPFGRDQSEVGRRVQAAGVGILLPRKKLTRRRLQKAVRDAMALQPAAREFAEKMKTEPGPAAAVQRLEELAGVKR
jgi:MGT family glycosyltransferase